MSQLSAVTIFKTCLYHFSGRYCTLLRRFPGWRHESPAVSAIMMLWLFVCMVFGMCQLIVNVTRHFPA
jgi:hypothetical protein